MGGILFKFIRISFLAYFGRYVVSATHVRSMLILGEKSVCDNVGVFCKTDIVILGAPLCLVCLS